MDEDMEIKEGDPIRIVSDHHMIEAMRGGDESEMLEKLKVIIDMAYYRGIADSATLVSQTQFKLIGSDQWTNHLTKLNEMK